MACSSTQRFHSLQPYDFVVFERLTEEILYQEAYIDTVYPGEKAELALLHFEAVKVVFPTSPVEFRL